MSKTSLPQTLAELFARDLDRLSTQVESYPTDADLWITRPGITNSAGNLTLHLCGNLRHFIGGTLGLTGYLRDREREFSATGLTREDLLDEISAAKSDTTVTLEYFAAERLEETYPLEVLGRADMRVSFFLLHLLGHLNYHLGQIDYHRRLLREAS